MYIGLGTVMQDILVISIHVGYTFIPVLICDMPMPTLYLQPYWKLLQIILQSATRYTSQN